MSLLMWHTDRWKSDGILSITMHTIELSIYITVWGEGNGNLLQYSCLENPTDGGAWWAAVHGISKGRTRLSTFNFTFHFPLSCIQFSSVRSLSRVRLFATPWLTARQASLSITNFRSSLKLMSIESVMPSSHLILCCPLLLLPPIPPSLRVFSNESTLRMRWPKYWSFSFSISPSKEHPRLIFRMDWLDLLAVQGTLKNLLQHHSSKASILRALSLQVLVIRSWVSAHGPWARFPSLCLSFLVYKMHSNDSLTKVHEY